MGNERSLESSSLELSEVGPKEVSWASCWVGRIGLTEGGRMLSEQGTWAVEGLSHAVFVRPGTHFEDLPAVYSLPSVCLLFRMLCHKRRGSVCSLASKDPKSTICKAGFSSRWEWSLLAQCSVKDIIGVQAMSPE